MIRDALCTLMTYCTLVAYPQEEGISIFIQVEMNCFCDLHIKTYAHWWPTHGSYAVNLFTKQSPNSLNLSKSNPIRSGVPPCTGA